MKALSQGTVSKDTQNFCLFLTKYYNVETLLDEIISNDILTTDY